MQDISQALFCTAQQKQKKLYIKLTESFTFHTVIVRAILSRKISCKGLWYTVLLYC